MQENGTEQPKVYSEYISLDPVQSTLPRLDTHPRAPFDSKSEDKEEISEPLCTDGSALEIPEEQERGTYTPGSQKFNKKELWEARQLIQ